MGNVPGGGKGNSRDRRRKRRSLEQHQPNPTSVSDSVFYRPETVPQSSHKGLLENTVGFIEQPIVLLPVSIVAGIVGIFWAPMSWLCAGCFAIGLHRQHAVKGRPVWVQLPAYFLVFLIGLGMVRGAKTVVEGATHGQTDELLGAIKGIVSKANDTNKAASNFPPPPIPSIVRPAPEHAVVSIGETSAERDTASRKTSLHLRIENATGAQTTILVTCDDYIDGQKTATTTNDLPKGPVLLPPHGALTLNMYTTFTDEQVERSIWEGNSRLEAEVHIEYDNKLYTYRGKLKPDAKNLALLESNTVQIKRQK